MTDILDDLRDLQKQATTEHSHYYVAAAPSYGDGAIAMIIPVPPLSHQEAEYCASQWLHTSEQTRRCCFCGADNRKGVVGYAGERSCPSCGKGGHGEPDEKSMAYKGHVLLQPLT